MGMHDGNLTFGLAAITNSTTPTASTDKLDAGSDVKLFSAPMAGYLCGRFPVTADADATVKVDFVGSDAADLDPNGNEAVPNVIIGSTGVISTGEDGVALGTGGTVAFQVALGGQTAARQYYGAIVTLGGTNPDCAADAKQLYVSLSPQTNMPGARAAIPA